MQEMWLDVQVVFLSESKLKLAMAHERSTLLTQQAFMSMRFLLTRLAPVGLKLTVIVPSGGDEMLILEVRTL